MHIKVQKTFWGGHHELIRCIAQHRARNRRRFLIAALAGTSAPASAQSGDPIKIGFSLALTGPLAPNGKQALLGAKIWKRRSTPKAACSAVKSSW